MIKYIIPSLFFLLHLVLETGVSFAQNTYPQNYFASPIHDELIVTGSFGELRTNHLHSGLDLKTENEGTEVYAIASGFVSRIKISATGYGKAIYISHPNGYVSVYAHLSRYNEQIENYIRTEQYKRESFEVELFPDPFQLPVLKSERIAYSGNTGGSAAPHLHFEIRDSKTEEIINPVLFGFNITDTVSPLIKNIVLYPHGKNSLVNGKNIPLKIQIERVQQSKYILKFNEKIEVSGWFYLGVETYDKENRTQSTNGIHEIMVTVDNVNTYHTEVNKFPFSITRYINAYVDYEEKIKSKSDIQLTYLRPNNKLSFYKKILNDGLLNFTDDKKHTIDIKVKDAFKNTSHVSFGVYSNSMKLTSKKTSVKSECTHVFRHNIKNEFEEGNVKVTIPAYALYDSLCFKYGGTYNKSNLLSPVYKIHDIYTPLQKAFEISIKVRIPEKLKSKVLLARMDENEKIVAEGGAYKDGVVKTNSRNFGDYFVTADTVPPVITPVYVDNVKKKKYNELRFKINDELSGIDTYRGTIDGYWILMEYDKKNGNLIYKLDEHVSDGKHTFNLTVKDQKGNVSSIERECYFER